MTYPPGPPPGSGYGPPHYGGPQPMYYAPRPAKRPPGAPGLGYTGLILAVVALVLSVTWVFVTGAQLRELASMEAGGGPTASPQQVGAALGSGILVQTIASVIGVTGLVLSIVATCLNRARICAIIGIVIAGSAPIIAYVVFALVLVSVGLEAPDWPETDPAGSVAALFGSS